MNMNITPPDVGSVGGRGAGKLRNLTNEYSTSVRHQTKTVVFDRRAHREIDRLIIEIEHLKTENRDLKSIVIGLLHEIDGGQI